MSSSQSHILWVTLYTLIHIVIRYTTTTTTVQDLSLIKVQIPKPDATFNKTTREVNIRILLKTNYSCLSKT